MSTIVGGQEPSLDQVLARAELLIDSRSGVIRSLDELSFPPGYEDQLYAYSALLGRPSSLHPLPCWPSHVVGELAGYGTSLDRRRAQVRAVCEAIERYCSVMYPIDGVILATAQELGSAALDISRLPQCSSEERVNACPTQRLRIPNCDSPEKWIRGYSLSRQRSLWVPLTATWLGLPDPLSEHLAFPQSTGFATGSGYEDAVLAGLCEVIERDSVALWWMHQSPMPRLDLSEERDPSLVELLRRAEKAKIQSTFFDFTTDIQVPVIGLVQTTEVRKPHVVVMAACRIDGLSAAIRVLEEAASIRLALGWSNEIASRDAILSSILSGQAHSPEMFGLLYADVEAPNRFQFALQHSPIKSAFPIPIDSDSPLSTIVARLAALDMEVIVVDVTLPEVRACGFVVVRVIVPELMPISFSHHIRYLAHPRLYAAPPRLGWGNRTPAMITRDPLPYA